MSVNNITQHKKRMFLSPKKARKMRSSPLYRLRGLLFPPRDWGLYADATLFAPPKEGGYITYVMVGRLEPPSYEIFVYRFPHSVLPEDLTPIQLAEFQVMEIQLASMKDTIGTGSTKIYSFTEMFIDVLADIHPYLPFIFRSFTSRVSTEVFHTGADFRITFRWKPVEALTFTRDKLPPKPLALLFQKVLSEIPYFALAEVWAYTHGEYEKTIRSILNRMKRGYADEYDLVVLYDEDEDSMDEL